MWTAHRGILTQERTERRRRISPAMFPSLGDEELCENGNDCPNSGNPSSIRTPEAGCTLSQRWCQAISEKAANTLSHFVLTAAVEAAPSCSSSYKTVEKNGLYSIVSNTDFVFFLCNFSKRLESLSVRVWMCLSSSHLNSWKRFTSNWAILPRLLRFCFYFPPPQRQLWPPFGAN